jgi:hypothetical protein
LFVVVVILIVVFLVDGFALVVGRVVLLKRGGREGGDVCFLGRGSNEGRGGEGVAEMGEGSLDVGHF